MRRIPPRSTRTDTLFPDSTRFRSYRRLIETSPDMVAVQRGGRFVFINAAGARMIGAQSPREVVGRRVLDFVLPDDHDAARASRSEEHTSELQSLMRISYAVFCLKQKNLITHSKRLISK